MDSALNLLSGNTGITTGSAIQKSTDSLDDLHSVLSGLNYGVVDHMVPYRLKYRFININNFISSIIYFICNTDVKIILQLDSNYRPSCCFCLLFLLLFFYNINLLDSIKKC